METVTLICQFQRLRQRLESVQSFQMNKKSTFLFLFLLLLFLYKSACQN